MDEMQLFYGSLTVSIIYLNIAGWIKTLNGLHMAPGL